jgi:hypothetical protein
METDPADAERFFGNRVVAGSDAWLPTGLWERAYRASWLPNPPDGTADLPRLRRQRRRRLDRDPRRDARRVPVHAPRPRWPAVDLEPGRALRPPHPAWRRDAAVDEIFGRFNVERLYYDPPYWTTEGEAWALKHGERARHPWETRRTTQMHAALERFVIDLATGAITHDGCPDTASHIASRSRSSAAATSTDSPRRPASRRSTPP